MKKIVLILSAALLLAACGEKQENEKMKPQVSKEEQAAAMQEVQAFIRDAGVYFIATEDGDQPQVRPFNSAEIIDGELYLLTGKKKDVFKQLEKNGKFALVSLNYQPEMAVMRLTGTLQLVDDRHVQETFLERNPMFSDSYQPGDDNMAMMRFTDVTVRYYAFPGPTEQRRTYFGL